MEIGMVGLGRMGMNMTRRLKRGGHGVAAYDVSAENVKHAESEGAVGAHSLAELVSILDPPRAVWVMVPAGGPVEDTVATLSSLLEEGDLVIDGGNSHYKDSVRRAERLKDLDIGFMDVGVSGGIWGLEEGYCLMAGGDIEDYHRILPVLNSLAPPEGGLYCGPHGAGHFVKMVHNGIEYGMMSAYGEGFDIIKASPYGDGMDFADVAHLWNRGSVVRSWLLELAEDAFRKGGDLSALSPYVDDSGEGRWTVEQAIDTAVPAPVITAALYQRFRSRGGGEFSDRLLSALRNEFGGHPVKKKE